MHVTVNIPEMIDVVFDLAGETPPVSYPFALWSEIVRLSPPLGKHENIGILPLRLPANHDATLHKRVKLIIRLPAALSEQALSDLSGHDIAVDGRKLSIGPGKKRNLQSHPTLHAHMVAGNPDEVSFMADMSEQMQKLGVTGNLICGKRHTLTNGQQSVQGFSLVIHDLKPDASLRLQFAGLGGSRQFGCGIFIPFKVITGIHDN